MGSKVDYFNLKEVRKGVTIDTFKVLGKITVEREVFMMFIKSRTFEQSDFVGLGSHDFFRSVHRYW